MKITWCPNCHQENGFLAFRSVQRGNKKYPYICHYDKKRYEQQKKDYLQGKRKSKPTGRKCCNVRLFDAVRLHFSGKGFVEYFKTLNRIHSKYYRFGFLNNNKEIKNFLNGTFGSRGLEKTRRAFVNDEHWNEDWKHCESFLKKAGYSSDLIRKKIMVDIVFDIDQRVGKKGFKSEFLWNVFLD